MQKPIINSTIITVAVTALAAFFGGLGGYYLSRSKSTFSRVIFVLVGVALYMPVQAVIIPTTITARSGLANSYLGLILAYLVINLASGIGVDGHILPGRSQGAMRSGGSGRRFQDRDFLPDHRPHLAAGLCFGSHPHFHPGVE